MRRTKSTRAALRAQLAIESAHSLDELEVIRRGLVVEILLRIELEGLCYARARQLGAEVGVADWIGGQPIVGDSA